MGQLSRGYFELLSLKLWLPHPPKLLLHKILWTQIMEKHSPSKLLQDVITDIAEIRRNMVTRDDLVRLPSVIATIVLRDVPGKTDKKKYCALQLLASSLLDGMTVPVRVCVAKDFLDHVRFTPTIATAFEAVCGDLSRPGAAKSFGQLLRDGESMDLTPFSIARVSGNGVRGASLWRISRLLP